MDSNNGKIESRHAANASIHQPGMTPAGASGEGEQAMDARLAGVIETLNSEHRHFLSLLDTLELNTDKLEPGKIPDYHLLLEIIDYLTHYPDQYHHPREDLLFATLLSADKTFESDLRRLEREHKTLRSYNDKLFAELKRIAAGRRVDRPELARNLRRYIDGYRQHMAFESNEVFPRASGELSAADMKKLQLKTRFIDDPLFGGEVENRYRRLERSIQARVSSLEADLLSAEISGIETTIGGVAALVERARQLGRGLVTVNRQALERNKETVRHHLSCGAAGDVMQLPSALLRNHRQYLEDSIAQVRSAFSESATQDRRG